MTARSVGWLMLSSFFLSLFLPKHGLELMARLSIQIMIKELKVPRCPDIREAKPGVSRQRIRQLEYAKAGICGICCTNKIEEGLKERCASCQLKFRLSRPTVKRFPAIWGENKPKLIEDLKAVDWNLPLEEIAQNLDLTVEQLKRYRRRYLGIKLKPGRPKK